MSQFESRTSDDSTTGTWVSSANQSVVPAATACDTDGDQYTAPCAGAPSTVPEARSPVGSTTVSVTGVSTRTVVDSWNTGGAGLPSGPYSPPPAPLVRNTPQSTKAGAAIVTSFSQYWNACTTVTARIPPAKTWNPTSAATTTAPTHVGVGSIVPNAIPAPCSCGTRYTTPTRTTHQVASVRNRGESSRDSAKSGSVYAPERRSGATTNNVNTRYPAVKPIGYHSASTPSVSTTPATPRNDAAERYSPLTAAALRRERTVRRARRKSWVVLAERAERCPRVNNTSTTHVTAASAHGFT